MSRFGLAPAAEDDLGEILDYIERDDPSAVKRVHNGRCRHPDSAIPWDNDRALVKIRDVIKMLEDDGWRIVRQRGSHRQLKHASKPGLVTVAGTPSDELAPGTLNSVLKQAGLKQ
jgi:predicted RNA binding protein YcfA (HicA-like mRNA interferase family)